MTYKAEILLGRILKIHGFEGTVTVKLEKRFIEKIPDIESVFLEIEGKPVPFFISQSEYPGADILRLRFQGYESAAKISEYAGCRVFLTDAATGVFELNTYEPVNLTGFSVFDKYKSIVGQVKEIIENPGQSLMSIQTGAGKEILVPLHDDLIVRIDHKKRTIIMELPDGLTEIN
jgi:16S rRNA processing protein RimM